MSFTDLHFAYFSYFFLLKGAGRFYEVKVKTELIQKVYFYCYTVNHDTILSFLSFVPCLFQC